MHCQVFMQEQKSEPSGQTKKPPCLSSILADSTGNDYFHFCVFHVRLVNIPNNKSLKRNLSDKAVRQKSGG